MFRSRALAKLQSPEKLDEPQKLIRRMNKASLATAIACPIIAVAWGFTGQVPEEGRGQGILLTPGSIKPVQVPATGQIVRWLVREGDVVKENQVLGYVEQIQMEQEIKRSLSKLEEVEERNRIIGQLRGQYSEARRESVEKRREILQNQITYLEGYVERTKKLTAETHRKNAAALGTQRRNLVESKKAAEEVEAQLKKRLESYKRLNAEKLISDDQLRDIRRDYEDAKLKIQEVNLRLQEMNLKQVELKEAKLNSENLITTRENNLTNLRLQLRELDNQLAQLDKQQKEAEFREESQEKEIQRTIDRSQKRLKIDREIRTKYPGRVLELSAVEGQLMTQSQRVAQIDTRQAGDKLMAIAYFKPKEGKQLEPGSIVRVTPSTVDKKKHGGIYGTVKTVSEYPVTTEAVTTQVGNQAVAQKLTSGGFTIEVTIELHENAANPSGFEWTSETGPDLEVTAGTYSEVWATVEQRLPASYVLPKIKDWFGV